MELITNQAMIDLLFRANELKDQRIIGDNVGKHIKNLLLALELYNKVLSKAGESSYLLATIANCEFMLGSLESKYQRFKEAIALMKRAVDLEPNNGELHAVLADYYELGTNEYENAAKECRKAIELCPYDVWALNRAAFLYRYPDHVVSLEESILWLERLIVLEPNNAGHHAFLAEQYQSIKRFQDAEREALRALLCARPLESGWIDSMKQILKTRTK
jgi:tetratricopeptide (TPR) repeat protein